MTLWQDSVDVLFCEKKLELHFHLCTNYCVGTAKLTIYSTNKIDLKLSELVMSDKLGKLREGEKESLGNLKKLYSLFMP